MQSSPATGASGGGAGSWPPGPPYQGPSPDYPAGGPSTPNNSKSHTSSSSNSKLKEQDKAPKETSLSQKQVEILSPRNSELRKTGSISSLRDALLATTASSAPIQQYTSYSSPRMGDHQASPATPSTNLPMTPESSSVISPQISVTAATRQDSQLLCPGASQDGNRTPYSRQNSAVSRAKEDRSQPPTEEDGGNRVPFQVENILGIKSDHSGAGSAPTGQPSPPVSNSLRDSGGGEGPGSNVNSPHTESPLGSTLTPNVVLGAQEGRGPAPGRPDLLGFPARSPSFRGGDKQPSPLTEDGKTVSYQII